MKKKSLQKHSIRDCTALVKYAIRKISTPNRQLSLMTLKSLPYHRTENILGKSESPPSLLPSLKLRSVGPTSYQRQNICLMALNKALEYYRHSMVIAKGKENQPKSQKTWITLPLESHMTLSNHILSLDPTCPSGIWER